MSKLYTKDSVSAAFIEGYRLGLRHGADITDGTRVPENEREAAALLAGLLTTLGLSQDRPRTYGIKKGRFRS